jgi:hypothetical protein
MEIYLASTAPGKEGTKGLPYIYMPRRLLSYYQIIAKQFFVDKVYKAMKDDNISCR